MNGEPRPSYDRISGSKVVLAGDIGGTNARFGLFIAGDGRPEAIETATYPSASLSSFDQGLRRFLDDHSANVSSACFGVAGPVIGGICNLTNLPWVVSQEAIKYQFQIEQVVLVNDLVAAAHAVPLLTPDDLVVLQAGSEDPNGNIGLLAPGTGLGVGFLFNLEGSMHAVASQGGHVDFAPTSDRQLYILQSLRKKFSRVTLECVASGGGMVEIYRVLRHLQQRTQSFVNGLDCSESMTPNLITRMALENRDALCLETVRTFLSIVGSVAGNLILTCMTTKGMYLAGGILPQLVPLINEGTLMESLLNKGQFRDLLLRIPVYLILNRDVGLIGAAAIAARA